MKRNAGAIVLLATLASCSARSGSTKMNDKTVRDIDIPAALVDDYHFKVPDWQDWSVSADGLKIAATSPHGHVAVLIDVTSGAVERHGETWLLDADRPLFTSDQHAFEDPGAQLTFVLPPGDGPQDETEFRNTGTGVLARLTRADRAAPTPLRLQVWNHQAALSWSTDVTPAPDTAGIAVSPSGDTVVLVQSTGSGRIGVRAFDVRDGRVRWSHDSELHGSDRTWQLSQPVYFSDDGASIWVGGKAAGTPKQVIEQLDVRDGKSVRTFELPHPLPEGRSRVAVTAAALREQIWIATVAYYERRDGGPPSNWSSTYTLYDLGRSEPVIDTEVRSDDQATIFDEPRTASSTARAFRPIAGGGAVLVQAHGDGLRVTTWHGPPGATR